MPLSPIPEVLEELRSGKPIVLVDDEDRENEGDLVYAAEKVTPEAVNFMLKEARGILCLALPGEVCDRLRLHSQTENDSASPPASAPATGRKPSKLPSPTTPSRRTCSVPAISILCAPAMAAFSFAQVKPKAPSIWRAWPA